MYRLGEVGLGRWTHSAAISQNLPGGVQAGGPGEAHAGWTYADGKWSHPDYPPPVPGGPETSHGGWVYEPDAPSQGKMTWIVAAGLAVALLLRKRR